MPHLIALNKAACCLSDLIKRACNHIYSELASKLHCSCCWSWVQLPGMVYVGLPQGLYEPRGSMINNSSTASPSLFLECIADLKEQFVLSITSFFSLFQFSLFSRKLWSGTISIHWKDSLLYSTYCDTDRKLLVEIGLTQCWELVPVTKRPFHVSVTIASILGFYLKKTNKKDWNRWREGQPNSSPKLHCCYKHTTLLDLIWKWERERKSMSVWEKLFWCLLNGLSLKSIFSENSWFCIMPADLTSHWHFIHKSRYLLKS